MNETDGHAAPAPVVAGKTLANREELLDDMALPFLDLAEKLEACRLNGAQPETWKALLETNLFLWRFISNFLPKHFDAAVTAETRELLRRISEFMIKVGVALEEGPERDPVLIRKVIHLNLNMCDQILAMRAEDPR
ncbi:MAG: hypothetical protein RIB97_10050 [Nitratireductor sp.]